MRWRLYIPCTVRAKTNANAEFLNLCFCLRTYYTWLHTWVLQLSSFKALHICWRSEKPSSSYVFPPLSNNIFSHYYYFFIFSTHLYTHCVCSCHKMCKKMLYNCALYKISIRQPLNKTCGQLFAQIKLDKLIHSNVLRWMEMHCCRLNGLYIQLDWICATEMHRIHFEFQ